MGRKGQSFWEGGVRPQAQEGTELMGRKGKSLWEGRDRPPSLNSRRLFQSFGAGIKGGVRL
jgi:hypothetical protein